MVNWWWQKKRYPKYTQPCPQERKNWVSVWTEELDKFTSDRKWTQTQKNQNKVLLAKIPRFMEQVMAHMAKNHSKYDTDSRLPRLATLCYLTIYANSQSHEFMFEFKMCPNMTPALGTVIKKHHIWTQYDDAWRTCCFTLPPEHTNYKTACIFVANNTTRDLKHGCFDRCFRIFEQDIDTNSTDGHPHPSTSPPGSSHPA